MEPLVERIREIMTEKGLSSSHFADAIGIQRPAVSHILSGRNRPSLDVVYKILERFKEIDPNWLLTGKGSMKVLKEEKKPEPAPVKPQAPEPPKEKPEKQVPPEAQADLFKTVLSDVLGKTPEPLPVKEKKIVREEIKAEKKVEKIVIFYSDNTCTVYSPS